MRTHGKVLSCASTHPRFPKIYSLKQAADVVPAAYKYFAGKLNQQHETAALCEDRNYKAAQRLKVQTLESIKMDRAQVYSITVSTDSKLLSHNIFVLGDPQYTPPETEVIPTVTRTDDKGNFNVIIKSSFPPFFLPKGYPIAQAIVMLNGPPEEYSSPIVLWSEVVGKDRPMTGCKLQHNNSTQSHRYVRYGGRRDGCLIHRVAVTLGAASSGWPRIGYTGFFASSTEQTCDSDRGPRRTDRICPSLCS